jgi:hypothetical protein
VADLLVITGPVASGKSSVAGAVGNRMRQAGRSVAILDFDDIVDTVGGFVGLTSERFRQAFAVLGQVIGSWLSLGVDVVAHAPAFEEPEIDAVLHCVLADTVVRRVLLLSTYEVALERAAVDPQRLLSKDSVRLRRAYDRFEASVSPSVPFDWTFDTTATSLDELVDRLCSDLIH